MERAWSEICLSYVADRRERLEREKRMARRREGLLAYEIVSLPDLIGCLLQSPLRDVYPPVTIINVLLHIAHVVIFKPELALVGRAVVLGFQRLAVNFRARSQVLLGVCKEIVRACTDEEGTAYFGIVDGQLGMSRGGTSTHELLYQRSRD